MRQFGAGRLTQSGHDALPDGGALIVYESFIDDDRLANTFGLLMSVNMLIETRAGFDYTFADCRSWMADAGFRDSYAEPLAGPDSMVVAIKLARNPSCEMSVACSEPGGRCSLGDPRVNTCLQSRRLVRREAAASPCELVTGLSQAACIVTRVAALLS